MYSTYAEVSEKVQPAKFGSIFVTKNIAEVILQFQSLPPQILSIIFCLGQ